MTPPSENRRTTPLPGKSLIAMCTAEHGDELHWEVESEADATNCPCWDCDCKPRLYVAVDDMPTSLRRAIVEERLP